MSGAVPRVAFVTRFHGQARGGLGRYEEQLLAALQGLCDVEPLPIAPVPIPSVLIRAATALGRDLATVARAHPLVLPRSTPDRVLHLPNQMMAPGLLWHRGPTARVVTVHDLIPLVAKAHGWNLGPTGWFDNALQQLGSRGLRRADHLIADSAATRDDVVRHLGIRPDAVRVVHLGVDAGAFGTVRPADADTRAGLGLTPGTRYVLYSGSLLPHKNVIVLARAMRAVRAAQADVVLVLTGAARVPPGDGIADELRRTLTEMQDEGIARPTGHLTAEQLQAVYRGAAAFVLPSLYEGFGFPALEAMAAGCPTIGAATSSIPEVVGDAGLLFAPRDHDDLARKLLRILSEPELASRLSLAGRERASRFTWQRTARETVEVYREAAELAAPRGGRA